MLLLIPFPIFFLFGELTPTNQLQKLLLEAFICHWKIEHFTKLLYFGGQMWIWQIGKHVYLEVSVEFDRIVIEFDVQTALYGRQFTTNYG